MSNAGRYRSTALSRHAISGHAWRSIIDFCGNDASFCYLIIPKFQNDSTILLLLAENGQRQLEKAKALASGSENRTDPLQEESRSIRARRVAEPQLRLRQARAGNVEAVALP